MATQTFVGAMSATFRQPNETPGQFAAQLKALNDDDRIYFSKALTEAGIEHEAPRLSAAAA